MNSRYSSSSVKSLIKVCIPLILVGCTSSQPKAQSEPMMNCPMTPSHSAIFEKASETFSNAPGLSETQKKKLTEIYRKTLTDAMQIRKDIVDQKAMLFELVATTDYAAPEVDRIKKKIVDLDQKRLTLMFKALSDVQAIVGYGKGKEDIYKHFRDYEVPTHGHEVTQN